jgi:hypothetical protein
LGYPEREAIQLVFDSFVPTFFVVPTEPVDDYYAGLAIDFDGRQEAWENMFEVTREEIEIIEGLPPVMCYVGFYEFYLTWFLYEPICCGGLRPECRQDDYSPVQT